LKAFITVEWTMFYANTAEFNMLLATKKFSAEPHHMFDN